MSPYGVRDIKETKKKKGNKKKKIIKAVKKGFGKLREYFDGLESFWDD